MNPHLPSFWHGLGILDGQGWIFTFLVTNPMFFGNKLDAGADFVLTVRIFFSVQYGPLNPVAQIQIPKLVPSWWQVPPFWHIPT